jgi:hypothetical protein
VKHELVASEHSSSEGKLLCYSRFTTRAGPWLIEPQTRYA